MLPPWHMCRFSFLPSSKMYMFDSKPQLRLKSLKKCAQIEKMFEASGLTVWPFDIISKNKKHCASSFPQYLFLSFRHCHLALLALGFLYASRWAFFSSRLWLWHWLVSWRCLSFSARSLLWLWYRPLMPLFWELLWLFPEVFSVPPGQDPSSIHPGQVFHPANGFMRRLKKYVWRILTVTALS